MSEKIGLSYVCGERKIVWETDLDSIGLEDFLLMVKNHKLVLTNEGADYIIETTENSVLEEANQATDFTRYEIGEVIYNYAVEELDDVCVFTKKDIYDLLSGKAKDTSDVFYGFFLENEALKLNVDSLLELFLVIQRNIDNIDINGLEELWEEDVFYQIACFDEEDLANQFTIYDIVRGMNEEDIPFEERLVRAIKECKIYQENLSLPKKERYVPERVKERILFYIDSFRPNLSEEDKEEYLKLMKELVEVKNPFALHLCCYSYYGGNEIVKEDYSISEKCLLELLNIRYDHGYANTLGYIYYYGRVNKGIPQYDLAYKYYTMAALTGDVEAKYKIGDMYRNGYYVEKNIEVASEIYDSLYKDVYAEFVDNPEDSSLADVAFRIGMMHEDSENPAELYYAMLSYLQALCAISLRNGKFDSGVKRGIIQKLLEMRETKYPIILNEFSEKQMILRCIRYTKMKVENGEAGNIQIMFYADEPFFVYDYKNLNCAYTKEITISFDGEIQDEIDEEALISYVDCEDGLVFYDENHYVIGSISSCQVKPLFDKELISNVQDNEEYTVAICQYAKGQGRKYTFFYEGEEDLNASWYIQETNQEIFPIEFKTILGYELPCSKEVIKHIKKK